MPCYNLGFTLTLWDVISASRGVIRALNYLVQRSMQVLLSMSGQLVFQQSLCFLAPAKSGSIRVAKIMSRVV